MGERGELVRGSKNAMYDITRPDFLQDIVEHLVRLLYAYILHYTMDAVKGNERMISKSTYHKSKESITVPILCHTLSSSLRTMYGCEFTKKLML